MASLSLKNINKTYPNGFVAVKNFNLEIADKEFIIFVGPSGCGKSTFLRSLNLLEMPTDGEIFLEGVNIADPKNDINKHRQKMGMVFQQFNLFPHMTILKNMCIAPMKLKKISKEDAEKYVMLGDLFTFISDYREFGDGFIKGKALDDRLGCAIMCYAIKEK